MKYDYLASPYAHPNPAIREERFLKAAECCAERLRRGFPTFSPIVHNHTLAMRFKLPDTWEFWQTVDFPLLASAASLLVLTLSGWRESTGVQAEIAFAAGHDIPTFYIDNYNEALP